MLNSRFLIANSQLAIPRLAIERLAIGDSRLAIDESRYGAAGSERVNSEPPPWVM
jgi:hypothetical protein